MVGGLLLLFFIIISLPFMVVEEILVGLSEAICQHPYTALSIYALVSSLIAFAYARGRNKQKILRLVATEVDFLTFGMVGILYLVPYIMMEDSMLSIIFEWLVVTIIMATITGIIITVFGRLSGWINLAVSLIFCGITFYLLHHNTLSVHSSDITWETIKTLYSWR